MAALRTKEESNSKSLIFAPKGKPETKTLSYVILSVSGAKDSDILLPNAQIKRLWLYGQVKI